jgi:hypothetical protein
MSDREGLGEGQGKLKAKSRELKTEISALCFPFLPEKTSYYSSNQG